jgi:5'(3')-deoxyribonucleotidase
MEMPVELTKPTIVWDLDDTLCDFMGATLEVVNTRLGKDMQLSDLSKGQWLQHHLEPHEISLVLPHIFCKSFYESLQPLPAFKGNAGSIYWRYLRDKYNFHVVTARQAALGDEALPVTAAWMQTQHLTVDGITITHPSASKVPHYPANTLFVVEDSPDKALEALKEHCVVFLVDHPWNRSLGQPANLIRCAPENLLSTMFNLLIRRDRSLHVSRTFATLDRVQAAESAAA